MLRRAGSLLPSEFSYFLEREDGLEPDGIQDLQCQHLRAERHRRPARPDSRAFHPEFILVSAGFDIFAGDPLGGMEVTPKGFSRLAQVVMEIADATAHGRIVLTLEGGYSVAGQRDSVKAVLKELAQDSPLDKKDLLEKEKMDYPGVERSILQIKEVQKRYWKSL
jgi:acetoin utilization deacetylase AcuC-like enzyme